MAFDGYQFPILRSWETLIPWNFSPLRKLLVNKSQGLGGLLQAWNISQTPLLDLHNLEIRIDGTQSKERNINISNLLGRFLEASPNLKVFALSVPNYPQILSLKSIAKGGKLRKLALLDEWRHEGRTDSDPLSTISLRYLKDNFPNIEELVVDLPMFPQTPARQRYNNTNTLEPYCFINCLAEFGNLTKLHLFAIGDLGTTPNEVANSQNADPVSTDAKAMMMDLHAKKTGSPFKQITITLNGSAKPPNLPQRPLCEAGNHGGDGKKYYRDHRRRFHSCIDGARQYKQWEKCAMDGVGSIPDVKDVSDTLNAWGWRIPGR